MGSSSYITDKEGNIVQHTEYIAFGEVLVDEHSVSKTMPYLFNAKELDFETGLYYYGARYYDAKVSLWLNTDPLSGYNPILETEHYIDGQHNGGIFNPMNMATYSYTYQNPILYVDPNGKQGIPGMLLGAVTEYGSIIGEKMLFENMSFSQANAIAFNMGENGEGWGNIKSIGVAAGFGAISGTAKFAKWAGSSTGRKILVKILETGIGALEDMIKQYVKDDDVDLTQTLISSLTDLGMEKMLKGTSLEKHLSKQEGIIEKAQKEISNIKSSNVGTKGGQAKKIRTQNAIINNAQKEIKTYSGANKVFNKTTTTGASTYTTGVYNANKEKNN
ncbi:hypothetical protein BPO_0252 [Bergeyella porcorum]|uniref:RHS repeat-associated core domain-containing protein n=1 Tax=Bergeyella porcorum TaxID=1735111 RepID=A0AAU0EYJ9_9FLAO